MTLTKTQKIAGTGVIAAIIAYFLWDGNRKRWQLFSNFGNSKFAGISTKNPDMLAIQVVDNNHGIKAGDTIDIAHSGDAPVGEVIVLEAVAEDVHGESWLVLDHEAVGTDKISGRYKLVKKA